MKTKTLSTLTFATALAVVGTATSAQAAALVGNISFGFNFAGSQPTYVGANLSSATSFTFPPTLLNTASTGDYASVLGGSSAVVGNPTLTLGPTTISAPLPTFSFSSTLFAGGTTPVNRFVFTPTTGLVSRTPTPNALTFTFDGTIVDSLGVFTPNSASAIINATQVGGPGNLISFSGTLISPSQFAAVPEPITMTGAALALGLGGLIKRKTRSSK